MNELFQLQPQEAEKDPLSVSEADLEHNFDILAMMPDALSAFVRVRWEASAYCTKADVRPLPKHMLRLAYSPSKTPTQSVMARAIFLFDEQGALSRRATKSARKTWARTESDKLRLMPSPQLAHIPCSRFS